MCSSAYRSPLIGQSLGGSGARGYLQFGGLDQPASPSDLLQSLLLSWNNLETEAPQSRQAVLNVDTCPCHTATGCSGERSSTWVAFDARCCLNLGPTEGARQNGLGTRGTQMPRTVGPGSRGRGGEGRAGGTALGLWNICPGVDSWGRILEGFRYLELVSAKIDALLRIFPAIKKRSWADGRFAFW